MKKSFGWLILIIFLLPFCVIGQEKERPMAIYSQAPEFSLPDMNNKMVNLSDFVNKNDVMIIVFRGWLGDHF